MDERRHYHRYLLHTEIEHECESQADVQQSMTKDISQGGICVTTEGAPLKSGAQYRLKFLLPFTDEEIKVTGIVKWNRKDGELFDNGIYFTQIESRYLDLIEDYSIGSVEEKE